MLDEHKVTSDWPRGLSDQLEEHNVEVIFATKLDQITENGVIVEDNSWHKYEIPANTVILSLGFRPRKAVVEDLSNVITDVYVAGDCKSPRISCRLFTTVSILP
jgi:NADH dehydrogenase FAD-containing subunit